MSTKQEVIKLIKKLPESVTTEDIMRELYVRSKIDKGLKDIEEGRIVSHKEARKRLNKWLTK